MTFAYLGPQGTFCEQALRTIPAAAEAKLIGAATIIEALQLVQDKQVNAAMVPLENSIEGAVNATLDELASGGLTITGQVLLPVVFGLYARTGHPLSHIKTVATHPHAEAQCRRWLRQHVAHAQYVPAASTADAAAAVAEGKYDAAVCSPLAGEEYQLAELGGDIADNRGAITRFVLVSTAGDVPPATGYDLTSLIVTPAHDRAGTLMEVLAQFAIRDINLTRIESRPTKTALGIYCFFLDCEGHIEDAAVSAAITSLENICDVQFLGSYPRAGS